MTKRKDALTSVETTETETVFDPVPGTPNADPIAAAGTWSDHPLPAEKAIANPEDPDSVTRIRYNPDGTVQRAKDAVPEGDLGPEGMPAASPDDAPFSTNDIPSGWNRYPTDEEVAYLNEKYPAAFDDAGNPTTPPVVDLTGTFTSFTPTNPTTVTADGEATAALEVGTIVTLEALTGTTEGMSIINGLNVVVLTDPTRPRWTSTSRPWTPMG